MNHHVIAYVRHNLWMANRMRQLTARSRWQKKLMIELAEQFG